MDRLRPIRTCTRSLPVALGALGALGALATTACFAPQVEVLPRFTQVDIDGEVGVDSSGSVSATNSTDDLGLEKDSSAFGGRVDLRWGSPHLTVSFGESSHDGDGTLSATMSSGGTTLPSSTPVHTDLDASLSSAILTFDLFPSDLVEVGLGFGVSAVGLDGRVTSKDPLNPGQIDFDQTLPVPVIAGRLAFDIGRVQLSALVSGLSFDSGDDHADFLDADVQGRVRLWGSGSRLVGFLAAGWREVSADVKFEDGGDHVEADLEFSGPYLGIVLGF
jgi:hypothetical protein